MLSAWECSLGPSCKHHDAAYAARYAMMQAQALQPTCPSVMQPLPPAWITARVVHSARTRLHSCSGAPSMATT